MATDAPQMYCHVVFLKKLKKTKKRILLFQLETAPRNDATTVVCLRAAFGIHNRWQFSSTYSDDWRSSTGGRWVCLIAKEQSRYANVLVSIKLIFFFHFIHLPPHPSIFMLLRATWPVARNREVAAPIAILVSINSNPLSLSLFLIPTLS